MKHNTNQLSTGTCWKDQVESLRTTLCLTETEESWDTIATSITSLTNILKCQADSNPVEVSSTLRGLARPLISALNSERSRLSGAAIELLSEVASALGTQFDPLMPQFFPPLLTLCTRTNKVFINRAKSCILAIIENTQLPSVLPHLLQGVKDKSSSLRLVSTEAALACINCCNPPDLEKDVRARDIESIIRATARDSSADVRKTSRKVFEAYKVLLPSRVDSFTAPLTPTMKKYLEIKAKPSSNLAPVNSRVQPPGASDPPLQPNRPTITLSSSTSTLRAPKPTFPTSRSQPHVRSVSSSAVPAGEETNGKAIERPEFKGRSVTHGRLPSQMTMPPPDFIPVRPPQGIKQTSVPSRVMSNTAEDRKRAISTTVTSSTRSGALTLVPGAVTSAESDSAIPTVQARRLQLSVPTTEVVPIRPGLKPLKNMPSGIEPPSTNQGAQRVLIQERPPEPEAKPANSSRPTSRTGLTTSMSKPALTSSAVQKSIGGAKGKGVANKVPEKPKPVPKLAGKPSVSNLASSSSLKPSFKPKPANSTSGAKDKSTNTKTDAGIGTVTAFASSRSTSKIGGATQPTLSQLSRAKAAVADRKVSVKSEAKPMWGGPPPVGRKAVVKKVEKGKAAEGPKGAGPSVEGREKVKVKTPIPTPVPREVPAPRSPSAKTPTPSEVPLPTSPANGEGEVEVQTPSEVLSPSSSVKEEEADMEVTPEEDVQTSQGEVAAESSEQVVSCPQENGLQMPSNEDGPVHEEVSSETPPVDGNVLKEAEIEELSAESLRSPSPTLITHLPTPLTQETTANQPSPNTFHILTKTPTPASTNEVESTIENPSTHTPISSLLMSIEQGFLMTPSSPLSPPQSYVARQDATPEVAKKLTVPFPLRGFGLKGVLGEVSCGDVEGEGRRELLTIS